MYDQRQKEVCGSQHTIFNHVHKCIYVQNINAPKLHGGSISPWTCLIFCLYHNRWVSQHPMNRRNKIFLKSENRDLILYKIFMSKIW